MGEKQHLQLSRNTSLLVINETYWYCSILCEWGFSVNMVHSRSPSIWVQYSLNIMIFNTRLPEYISPILLKTALYWTQRGHQLHEEVIGEMNEEIKNSLNCFY